jgi:hypothetical protein
MRRQTHIPDTKKIQSSNKYHNYLCGLVKSLFVATGLQSFFKKDGCIKHILVCKFTSFAMYLVHIEIPKTTYNSINT